jgi:DNA polymerase
MAYAINNLPIQLWTLKDPWPETLFTEGHMVIGHNIMNFDRVLINELTPTQLPKDHIIDTMAIAGRFGLPQSLAGLSSALKVGAQKRWDGPSLIRQFCRPNYAGKFNSCTGPKWKKFCEYCAQDVNVLRKVHKALPADDLNSSERKIWEVSTTINDTGVPVDQHSVTVIYDALATAREAQLKNLPQLTQGSVKTIGQVAKIKAWCATQGITLNNLQAATVERALDNPSIPQAVKQVLELRQQHGRSSVSKYESIFFRAYKGRVYDGLRYYGAATGRYSGMGVQWQNFPRNVPPDDEVEELLGNFYNDDDVAEDMETVLKAKSVLRAMIKAPEGKTLLAADYSSIEYVTLCWLAGELEALERFREGFDAYVDMAAFSFAKPYEQIDKVERQFGKTLILGCGYMLGGKGFMDYASSLNLTEEQSYLAVEKYREKYPMIVDAWYSLHRAAVTTVRTGMETSAYHCTFRLVQDRNKNVWLQMTIPSGRAIYYFNPSLTINQWDRETIMHTGFIPGGGKKWGEVYLSISRLIENIIQGLARDIMVSHMLKTIKLAPIVTTIHDEIVYELQKMQNEKIIEKIILTMETPPDWCDTLPLRVTYRLAERYGK